MLSEKTVFDAITILEDGQMQVRKARVILVDNAEITRIYHREIVEPDADVSKLPPEISRLANVVWTKEVVDAYKVEKAKNTPTPIKTGK